MKKVIKDPKNEIRNKGLEVKKLVIVTAERGYRED